VCWCVGRLLRRKCWRFWSEFWWTTTRRQRQSSIRSRPSSNWAHVSIHPTHRCMLSLICSDSRFQSAVSVRVVLFCLSVTHTHTHPFNGPLFVTMQVSRYQKGKAILNFTEARDSEWQWHQPGHMQVCTLLQTDDHASTPPLSFLQAGCPFCRPTNSEKALKAHQHQRQHRGLNVRCRQWLEGRWQNWSFF